MSRHGTGTSHVTRGVASVEGAGAKEATRDKIGQSTAEQETKGSIVRRIEGQCPDVITISFITIEYGYQQS